MSLTTNVTLRVSANYTKVKGYGSAAYSLLDNHPILAALGATGIALGDGTGTGQADLIWVTDGNNPPTLGPSATTTVDLNGLTDDALGDDIALAKVKIILVYADPANLNDLLVGPGATNGFLGPFSAATGRQTVRAGGVYLSINPTTGFPVTPGTNDQWSFINAAGTNTITYHSLIVGTSV